jgi:AraC family transcriptional regulator, regulatory protein of adaptative response / methylated-DNA-[protein]-cysteine methyltransferase
MLTFENINYQRIEKAIRFINSNFKSQPSLEDIASEINLSPFHFQKLFSDWAGVSPKKFLQYISLQYAKSLLKNNTTLFTIASAGGLSGTSRLHDLFVNIEAMTPGEYKNGGENLSINYNFYNTIFGKALLASTTKGLCSMAFYNEETTAFELLKEQYYNAVFNNVTDDFHTNAIEFFKENEGYKKLKLHLKGTPFQLKVWEALLKIPEGKLSTYGKIANEINSPKAGRAVGTAIGRNPIAYIIPCHRVIQSTGVFGGYMWGSDRKAAIIGWEAAKINSEKHVETF